MENPTPRPDFLMDTEGNLIPMDDDGPTIAHSVPRVPAGVHIPDDRGLLRFLSGYTQSPVEDTPLTKLMDQIDDVKTKISDKEYIDLMNTLKDMNDKKQVLYEITMVTIKVRYDDKVYFIYPVYEKRIYPKSKFTISNPKELIGKHIEFDCEDDRISRFSDWSSYDCSDAYRDMMFRRHMCVDIKKL